MAQCRWAMKDLHLEDLSYGFYGGNLRELENLKFDLRPQIFFLEIYPNLPFGVDIYAFQFWDYNIVITTVNFLHPNGEVVILILELRFQNYYFGILNLEFLFSKSDVRISILLFGLRN